MITTWVRTLLFPPLGIPTFFYPLNTARHVPAAITLLEMASSRSEPPGRNGGLANYGPSQKMGEANRWYLIVRPLSPYCFVHEQSKLILGGRMGNLPPSGLWANLVVISGTWGSSFV